jgi:hypothetical protein
MDEQENSNDQAENHEEENVSEEKNKQGKTYFSWRVYEDENGGVRSEFYTNPEWKKKRDAGEGPDFEMRFGPGMCGPFVMHGFGRGMGRMGRKFARRMEHMGERMERRGQRMRRKWGKEGREKMRDMLDKFESMYDEFYGDGVDEDGPEVSEA